MAGIVQLLISDTIMSFMWVRSSVPVQLLIFDTIMSFMWVWSGVLIKLFVHNVLGFNHDGFPAEVFRSSLSILDMVFFAYIAKLTNGGAYNPLTVLSSAIWPISGNFVTFFFTIGLRILFQVMGAITGVNCILATFPEKGFPEIGRGPRLTVSPSEGALTEGLLTFTIVLISHGLSTKIPGSFFRKTWIASVSRVALRTLGSDLTGGCMNPAFVMGWAYARGDHITMEHLLVYWVAPIVATLLATWTFTYLERTSKQDKEKKTN